MDRKNTSILTSGDRLELLHRNIRLEEESKRKQQERMAKACEKFMMDDPSIKFFFEIQQDMGHYSRSRRRRLLRINTAATLRREEEKLVREGPSPQPSPRIRTVDRKKMQLACQKFMIDDVHIAKQQNKLVQTLAKSHKSKPNNAFKEQRKRIARSA